MVASEVVGFDVASAESWLATVAPVRAPFVWTRLTGGHSNLTYLVRDAGGHELVIRRPPLGPLLPKAHDMWREFRIIKGLWPTEVPVPEPVAYCGGAGVAETHFYTMGKSNGKALYEPSVVESWLDSPSAGASGTGLRAGPRRPALHRSGRCRSGRPGPSSTDTSLDRSRLGTPHGQHRWGAPGMTIPEFMNYTIYSRRGYPSRARAASRAR